MILRGLRELFAQHDGFCVVGAERYAARIAAAVAELAPDVLVADYMLHGTTSLAAIREVTQKHPATAVVVVSMHSELGYVRDAFDNGARGYVLKTADSDEFVRAVRRVHAGQMHLTPPLTWRQLDEYARDVQRRGRGAHEALTKRELDVLRLVAQGHTSSEIATELQIGRRTVESHRANLLAKLGLRNQAGLVRYALQNGIVAPH